jgi:hypothetical protein
MKHLKVTTSILAIAFIALTITSCKENKKDQDKDVDHVTEMKHDDKKMTHDNSDGHHDEDNVDETTDTRDLKMSTQKSSSTTLIIDAYIQIKNGLVADNKENAAKGATALLTAFSKFDMTKLSGEANKDYMEIYESAKEQAEHIVKSPIDHQREHFETLSTDINDLVTLLGTEKTLYQDYCPMKKVSWLSETKDVKNPYYGSKMLTCGSVKKQIN